MRKCADCSNWNRPTGECRRHPPPPNMYTRWPKTAEDDWCGEFFERDAAWGLTPAYPPDPRKP